MPFHTKNLSVGGAMIKTEYPLQTGVTGTIEFDQILDHLDPITVRVIREAERSAEGKYVSALKFKKLPKKARKEIKSVVKSFSDDTFSQ